MPPRPWQSFRKPDPNQEYLALLSYLPLKHFWMIPKFLIYVFETQKQLSQSEGLIGYSLLAHPIAKNFWTLSAWENEKALNDFVRKAPHSRVAMAMLPHMDQTKTKFVRWSVRGSELPLKWKEALRRS